MSARVRQRAVGGDGLRPGEVSSRWDVAAWGHAPTHLMRQQQVVEHRGDALLPAVVPRGVAPERDDREARQTREPVAQLHVVVDAAGAGAGVLGRGSIG